MHCTNKVITTAVLIVNIHATCKEHEPQTVAICRKRERQPHCANSVLSKSQVLSIFLRLEGKQTFPQYLTSELSGLMNSSDSLRGRSKICAFVILLKIKFKYLTND